MELSAYDVLTAAREHGFELAGIAAVDAGAVDFPRYMDWVENGYAGRMSYLSDRRAAVRSDPRNLMASTRSILCVGKLYNRAGVAEGIAKYAQGEDYHDFMRRDLERMVAALQKVQPFEARICVDTAPLLERSLARQAGLGWIGKNTCLINQQQGSWFLLAEVLLSLELTANPEPPPDRCGSCTRCIDACPTRAIVPDGANGWTLDARACISYFTIELKGPVPEEYRASVGNNIFGCDICQDVCPWNRRAPETSAGEFFTFPDASLGDLLNLDAPEFRLRFEGTPVSRARYTGFLRNVLVAAGNSGDQSLREPVLRILESSTEEIVREHAIWALRQLDGSGGGSGSVD
ncbi:epoxyqueuosine reductase [Bryobacterales bacterium F-183]|nr:epoxyqueuosine reductase [Bryobacterales bacterium F-183]